MTLATHGAEGVWVAAVSTRVKIAWYEVTPERMFFIDNSVKLGHREEIAI